jgi:hypothetical protein
MNSTPCGIVDVKGKGDMELFYLVGRKPMVGL